MTGAVTIQLVRAVLLYRDLGVKGFVDRRYEILVIRNNPTIVSLSYLPLL